MQGFNALCVKSSAIAQLFGCYGDVLKVRVPGCIEENVIVLPNVSSPFFNEGYGTEYNTSK